jgi:hypothetical protein
VKTCVHGDPIPEGSRAQRSPNCLACHREFLDAAAERSATYRRSLTEEEAAAWAEYRKAYNEMHRDRASALRRLRRAEQRLVAALGTTDIDLIQKRRLEFALAGELIQFFPLW